jgi:hypothetical protein
MSDTQAAQSAIKNAIPTPRSSAGHNGTLNGHSTCDTQTGCAVEGQDSPQAITGSVPSVRPPAGTQTAQSANTHTASTHVSLAGHQNGRGQCSDDSQIEIAPAPGIPGAQGNSDIHAGLGTGEQAPPAARKDTTPNGSSPLADDPVFSLTADLLDDLEKARIAAENRYSALTRTEPDKDGYIRGRAIPEGDPAMCRARDLLNALAAAEHQGALSLQYQMRHHPLGPWLAAQRGIGEKQGARLLATIGDPYMRPQITREDGTVEPPRPRLVSELWSYCGLGDAGKQVRRKYVKANWSSKAKSRAYLIAESCMKTLRKPCTRADGDDFAVHAGGCHCSPYRLLYDAERERLANAVHATECIRCGPAGEPALAGSPLSAGLK